MRAGSAGTESPAAPTSPGNDDVARRLARLRSDSDLAGAAEEAWEWLSELREEAESDAEAVVTELARMFALGSVPRDLDGPTDGMLVATTINPLVDPAVRLVTRLWMPWHGKRFDAAREAGANRLASSSSLPSRLLWPLYSMRDADDGKLAFDFRTSTERGKVDPDLDVLVIDYSAVEGNPAFIIRSIRDELVQLVPGAFLGKILFRLPSERYETVGFFALRAPVGAIAG